MTEATTATDDLFVRHDVWKRVDEAKCIRYVVLMHTATGKFAVQSEDWFHRNGVDDARYFERQFVELLLDTSPLDRCSWHDSIVDAIRAHDADFR